MGRPGNAAQGSGARRQIFRPGPHRRAPGYRGPPGMRGQRCAGGRGGDRHPGGGWRGIVISVTIIITAERAGGGRRRRGGASDSSA